jgi:hypothetical protein
MVKKKLVEQLITDGARLLHKLDAENFPVESMFWVHLPEEDYWRLVIASPAVSQEGSAPGYRRLNEMLRAIEPAGVTLEDISLLDPASRQFQSLYSLASTSGRLAAGPEWIEFEDAIVYRWTHESIDAELQCDIAAGELNDLWEAERRRSNLPALLISANGRRVALRFHPQHSPLSGIQNIKQPFQIALHRAHPDCQVTWPS